MDLVNSLTDRLLFAIPKKGRLHTAALDLLQGSDMQFKRENRLDLAVVKNLDVALVFLPAADIPTFVGEGRVDLGITGADQVAEHDAQLAHDEESNCEQILDLGFGKCKLQVQVPAKGRIKHPRELIGKNVVTSFTALTEDYFARLENGKSRKESINGSALVKPALSTKIRFVGGSVEAACALGVADGIVDLVESGETMRAAGLCAIDTVVESSAVLIQSRRVNAVNAERINIIKGRFVGLIQAQKYVLLIYNITSDKLQAATTITPGKRAPTLQALKGEDDAYAVSVMVPKSELATKMDQLLEVGATDILAMQIANSRGS